MFWLAILFATGIILYVISKQSKKSPTFSPNIPQYDHAIIIGGSIGGMVTAGYLSKYFSRITVIESDDVLNDSLMKSTPEEILNYRCRLGSPTSIGRAGVSQIYQLHVLQGEGLNILRELFPRLEDILTSQYNVRSYSLLTESIVSFEGHLLANNVKEDFKWLGVDRFTLETIVRREFCLRYGNRIEWKCKSRVMQLIVDQSLNMVKGVKYRSKENLGSLAVDMYGDLIIDCSGRNSSSTKWLRESFNLNIPSTQMYCGIGYVTFVGERMKTGDSSIDSKFMIGSGPMLPDKETGCVITPIRQIKTTDENSLATLSTIAVVCVDTKFPPNDSYENLLEWAKENLEPEIYSILKSTKVYSPLLPYRRAMNDRKHVELLGKKWPQNYLLLGDAVCAFNPIYAQGMTHACRQARELGKILAEKNNKLQDIAHIYNRRATSISNESWFAAVVSDWKTPVLKIVETDKSGLTKTYSRGGDFAADKNSQVRTPLMFRLLHWYNHWLLTCASTSGEISTTFFHILNQHSSPLLLVQPKIILTVCYTVLRHYLIRSKK